MPTVINHRAGYYTPTYNTEATSEGQALGRVQTQRIVLKPGANVVADEVWRHVEGNPQLQARIKRGEIEVLDASGKGAAIELCALPPNEALRVARETVDLDLLQAWHGAEKRDPVRNVLDEQISKISRPDEPDDSDESRGRRQRGRQRGAA